MPLVEVLGTSRSQAKSGWAYVPDTSSSYQTSSATTNTGRKRGILKPNDRRTDLTSRQNHAVLRHLAELDRENHRDNVHVPVPVRKDAIQRDNARVARAKTTSNVRRIVQSQKTFRNYLDDEEAALAHQSASGSASTTGVVGGGGGGAGSAGVGGTPVSKVAKIAARRSVTPISKQAAAAAAAAPTAEVLSDRQKRAMARKSSTTDAVASPSSGKKRKGTVAASKDETPTTTKTAGKETQKADDVDKDTTDDAMQIDNPEPAPEPEPVIHGLIKSTHDNEHLLKSYIPHAPSDRLMAALLAEPPLRYHAARAEQSASGKPARHFCTICGYWGKIKCKNCGVRMCGLECYKVHEDSRCGAFF